ncbi:MAG: hypothetical protein IT453_21410 [Planctomycetes bacterium]|nr:hypothetical protein [Planctomycetota bacterium]
MNRTILTAALLPFAWFSGGESPSAPAVTWRTYDLGAIAPRLAAESALVNLLPTLAQSGEFSRAGEAPFERWTDSLAQLAILATGDEFEREGRTWSTDDDDQLHVCASADAQKLLEREFAFFGEALRSTIAVRVDVVDGDLGAQGVATRLPAAAADELVARAAAQGKVRTMQLRIAPGSEVRVDNTRELRALCDYDVEVAQQALALQPMIRTYRVGTQLFARAAHVADGVQLALVLRQVDEAAPMRERMVEYVNYIANSQLVTTPSAALLFQSPSIVQHAEALTTFLPKGEAVIVRSSYANLETNTRCTFVLRALGEAPPAVQGVDLYENGYRLDVVDLTRFAPPRVRIAGSLLDRGEGASLLEGFYSEATWNRADPFAASAVQSGDELALARERHFPSRDALFGEMLGSWLVLQPSSVDPAATHPRNFDPAALAAIARPKSTELDVTLRRGETVVARWSGSVVDGERSAFTVGAESLGLDSATIEIAQSASVFDPQVRVFFDGLLVALEPRRLANGGFDVRVTARARVLDAAPTLAVGMKGATPPSDTATWSNLVSDERVQLAAGGEARALLGVAGKGGLTLEIGAR